MTILSEQVRVLSTEDNLINDSANYTTASTTFATLKNFGNVVVPSDGLVLIKFTQGNALNAATSRIRIKIGGVYAYATRYATATTGTTTFSFICFLAAGTYEIIAEGLITAGNTLTLSGFQLGFVSLLDLQGAALAVYASGISKTTTVRMTPLGNIKNTVYVITVYATTAGGQTNLENPGDALTNGVQVLLDAVQQSWGERYQGDANDMPAGGKLYVSASAGSSHTVTIGKDNAGTVVNISVAVCPWILPAVVFEPITLDFSQGSTVYVVAEPLDANPTKLVGVGKERAVTFGASTDYYGSSSAVDIIAFSYTFEVVKVGGCGVFASGFGGCISHIAVDVR